MKNLDIKNYLYHGIVDWEIMIMEKREKIFV